MALGASLAGWTGVLGQEHHSVNGAMLLLPIGMASMGAQRSLGTIYWRTNGNRNSNRERQGLKIFTKQVLRKSCKLISNDFICLRKSFTKNFCE